MIYEFRNVASVTVLITSVSESAVYLVI